ncbi:hypothetical protein RRG08_031640 [Elysia crispata]|uniref:MADF domain-containing protein n=1 Tax=Elysia crispata TaxID=231223 RepID=A0AAE1AC38_9GAST|nr:hypothetical protein RRG08_031640 [Elysia crispata]
MDTEQLISEIYKRKIIWDKRIKLHSNHIAVDKCWFKISQEMGLKEALLKKNWKYLRDQFAVEWGKLPHTRSGDAADNSTTKWQYFKSLLFLKDVRPRVTEGPLKALLSQWNERPSVSNDIAEEESQNSILDNSTQNPSNHSNSSDMEVLVEDGRSPQHPNLFPELSVQGQIKRKGKGKRKRDNMNDYQRQTLK